MAAMGVLRPWAAAATAWVAWSACAAAPSRLDDFVGTWTRTWPTGDCPVTVEIRPDGTITTIDGDRRIDATLAFTGGSDKPGFVAVARQVTRDNPGPACARKSASPQDIDPARTPADRSTAQELQAVLPFAHGDAMAFCRFANLGGCDDWYERASPRRSAVPARHDLEAAALRQFYAVIPENRASFELATLGTDEPLSMADRDAPGGLRQLACGHTVRFSVVGHGATDWNFLVASCSDAALIERLALKLVAGDPRRQAAADAALPAGERRRYGLDPLDRQHADGSRTVYAIDEVHGVDASMLVHWAVHIDARRQHAVLVMGVDMGTLVGPLPQFAANPLYRDPAAAMQALVERLARDPDARR